jgi:type II secretory ATPase GspE/PulE/Tfp pilus assembly ATPase PilB-like protein
MRLTETTITRVVSHLRERDRLPGDVGERLAALAPGSLALQDLASGLGVSRQTVLQGIADLQNLPFIDLVGVMPAPDALASVPEALPRAHRCLPLFLNGRELTIAVATPDWNAMDAIARELPGLELVFVLAEEPEILALLALCFPTDAELMVSAYLRDLGDREASAMQLQQLGEKAPIVAMIDAMLERAIRMGASDAHLEPHEDASVVRLRVDGLLLKAFSFPRPLHDALVSRLKILGNLNLVERQRPQDGRFTFASRSRPVEVRLSTLRMQEGEKVVMRLSQANDTVPVELGRLGLAPDTEQALRTMLAQPYGLLLVTGPTGSGKSSTLYAALQHLNAPERNIITLEDPVERRLPGLNQVPMKEDRGVTFASALRSVLRQDPDVIMVGEIRDQETADQAIRGALTGHLLLSTLHANGAAEAVARLVEMGVRPNNLAASLVGIIAQRLVRRICPCHGYGPADPDLLAIFGLEFLGPDVVVVVPRGCPDCHQTGFRGRLALFEVMEATSNIKRLVIENAGTDRLRQAAEAAGMRTLLAAGAREALAGRTTFEEVLRVVSHPH